MICGDFNDFGDFDEYPFGGLRDFDEFGEYPFGVLSDFDDDSSCFIEEIGRAHV